MPHARFLVWITRTVRAANDAWRIRRPDLGGEVLTRQGLVSHLYHWSIADGRWPDGKAPARPTVAVATIYRDDPDAVVSEARRYWFQCLKEQAS